MRKLMLVCCALVLASAVSAKENEKFEAGLFFPAVSATVFGDWGNSAGTSMAAGGFGYYTFRERMALGLEMAYDFGHPLKGTNIDITMFRLSPLFKYGGETTMFGKPAVYYSVFGLGYYHSSAEGSTSNDIGFSIGEGVGVEFSPCWLAGMEVRWHHVFSDPASNNLDFMPKLSYKF